MKKIGQSTLSVHSGTIKDSNGGTTSPIYPSTAYQYVNVDKYFYPRYFNVPNQEAAESKIAALEGAEKGMIFSSGMAATMSILLSFLENGDHVLLQEDIYGGTHDSVTKELTKWGIEVTFSNSSIEALINNVQVNTKIIFIETPSNPLLKITDIEAVAHLGKEKGITTVIDNTFASPINQNPHKYGIDIVMHSATKYLGGHSDISAGAATMSAHHYERIRESSLHLGGNLDVQACWLLERSMKTLDIRVREQNKNAGLIAAKLVEHKKIETVYYPGLESHPLHKLAKKQMSGFGGMLSFEVSGDADEFVKSLQLISPAMSLGGVESTITAPTQTSHARISEDQRAALGIKSNLLRLSVGIENAEDLIEDLIQALDKL